mmetsp:Transcript_54725/g.129945  ORF Transcript_54725/g.129945 Transcript_54725/m.129945 type:complete len:390 (-) Transcript_54725:549-1718(-)
MRHVHSHSRASPPAPLRPASPPTSCDTTSPNCTSTPSSASRSGLLASFHPRRCACSSSHSTLSCTSLSTILRTPACSSRPSFANPGTTQSALASWAAALGRARASVLSSAASGSWWTRGRTRSIMSVGRGRSQSSCTSMNPSRLQNPSAPCTSTVCPSHCPRSTSTASSMGTATRPHSCARHASLTVVYPFGMLSRMNGKARAHLTSTSRTATAVLPSPPTLSTQCTLPSASSMVTAGASRSLPAADLDVTTRTLFCSCEARVRRCSRSCGATPLPCPPPSSVPRPACCCISLILSSPTAIESANCTTCPRRFSSSVCVCWFRSSSSTATAFSTSAHIFETCAWCCSKVSPSGGEHHREQTSSTRQLGTCACNIRNHIKTKSSMSCPAV